MWSSYWIRFVRHIGRFVSNAGLVFALGRLNGSKYCPNIARLPIMQTREIVLIFEILLSCKHSTDCVFPGQMNYRSWAS